MCKTLQIIALCLSGIVFFGISLSGEVRAEVKVENQSTAHGRYMSQIAGCNDCHTNTDVIIVELKENRTFDETEKNLK
jgi:hypothetical protein